MKNKFILSIDGGGIRGIIPICALVSLEEHTGKLTRETFSFVAGTSTGAIIAASVAAGIPAKDLLNSYIRLSSKLFTKSIFNWVKRFFLGYFYSTQKLHDLIKSELEEAKEWEINDSPIDLLISAKAIRDGKPWYFVKDNPQNSKRTGHLPLVDCVTASASAPTYFYPWKVPEKKEKAVGRTPIGLLTDGGVGIAGNPVYQACVEAFFYTDKYVPSDTVVVSLGTGRFETQFVPGWIFSWLSWILKELLQSTGEQQTEIVQRHFPKTPFYRLDPDLKMLDPNLKGEIKLDDASEAKRLVEYGQTFAPQIPWEDILESKKDNFSIDSHNNEWKQYKRSLISKEIKRSFIFSQSSKIKSPR